MVNKQVADLIAWSLKQAASGVAPSQGFYGEEFAKNTWRYEMAGQPLANGAKTFGFDLKAIVLLAVVCW